MYARYRTALPTGCLRTMADARWSVHIDDDGAGAAAGAGEGAGAAKFRQLGPGYAKVCVRRWQGRVRSKPYQARV